MWTRKMCKNRRGGEKEESRGEILFGGESHEKGLSSSPPAPPLSRSYTPGARE
jgi:hypothetical protein